MAADKGTGNISAELERAIFLFQKLLVDEKLYYRANNYQLPVSRPVSDEDVEGAFDSLLKAMRAGADDQHSTDVPLQAERSVATQMITRLFTAAHAGSRAIKLPMMLEFAKELFLQETSREAQRFALYFLAKGANSGSDQDRKIYHRAYARVCRATLERYEWPASYGHRLANDVAALALCMPNTLSLGDKHNLLDEISFAADRGGSDLQNFWPMADLLGKVAGARFSAADRAAPAELDTRVVTVAQKLGTGLRRHLNEAALDEVNQFSAQVKVRLTAIYSPSAKSDRRDFAVHGLAVAALLDPRQWFSERVESRLAVIKEHARDVMRYDANGITRRLMWRNLKPLQYALLRHLPFGSRLPQSGLRVSHTKRSLFVPS